MVSVRILIRPVRSAFAGACGCSCAWYKGYLGLRHAARLGVRSRTSLLDVSPPTRSTKPAGVSPPGSAVHCTSRTSQVRGVRLRRSTITTGSKNAASSAMSRVRRQPDSTRAGSIPPRAPACWRDDRHEQLQLLICRRIDASHASPRAARSGRTRPRSRLPQRIGNAACRLSVLGA